MTALLAGKRLDDLEALARELITAPDRLAVLNADPVVLDFFSQPLPAFFEGLCFEEELVVKSIVAVGQGRRVFSHSPSLKGVKERFRELLDQLLAVEKFYHELGGIVGYHWKVLSLMHAQETELSNAKYHRPEGIDISHRSEGVYEAILSGIEHLPELAEIYPVGGAADRLRLHDQRTGLPLPAAKLVFCGKTLLEGLIGDLQAREYLYYKLFGKQVITPIAMMTSLEKDNHAQILSICEENRWFLRPKEGFRFFCQPSVPAINSAGEWCLQGALRPLFKPGGHGVLWKLARDEQVFDWLFRLDRRKALVRQINNPIAGCDHGLLAFAGMGSRKDKAFGFASCARRVKASEGVNVLIEKEEGRFVLTNIEYCDFKRFQIVDEAVEAGSLYSKFSCNTNILFADLQAVLDAVSKTPLPGMLVNFKKTTYCREDGRIVEEEMGRLESTMQNIADLFDPVEVDSLQTFLTYNERCKTISTVKREFVLGSSLLETPEGCFLDLLKNARELLVYQCGFAVPEVNEPAIFFTQGPSFIFFYHPALGPLYDVIAQKLRGGVIKRGGELILEIAELDVVELTVEGSLSIRSEALMGHEEEGVLVYSERTGKCVLKNVHVVNKGIDWESSNVFWRGDIARREILSIVIQGDGELYAENVTFRGGMEIVVQPATRVTVLERDGEIELLRESLSCPGWWWHYSTDGKGKVCLTK